ncbi:MAG: hypothetical protein PHT50_01915 [Candidatus Omnitrophica bacterium]|nr:hypothetical protein [Candidatus Omnitrophota bacterium]
MAYRLRKILSFFLCFLLIFQQSGFTQIAGELDISGRFLALRNSFIQDRFRPIHLRYLSYDPSINNFSLLLDKGDFLKGLSPKDKAPKPIGWFGAPPSAGVVPEEILQQETKTLLNYFFIGISLPNEAFWVNLRPDSPNNIIDPEVAETDVGRILLEADLQLKKDTASFTSPQTPEGKDYWDKLYKKAEELYGSENITIPTLTRPWIVPDEIIIRESSDNAYIYKATLKVMLEQDYLKDSLVYNFTDGRSKALNEYSSELIRNTIIPRLTREINSSKRYAPLRQVYYSLILAQWFKQKFYGKSGLYSYLIDKHNLQGLASKSPWSKTDYFNAYKVSFEQGEYNIKEPRYTPFGQVIRSYMSGGIQLGGPEAIKQIIHAKPAGNSSPLFFRNNYIVQGLAKVSSAIDAPYHIEAIDINNIIQGATNSKQQPSSSPLQSDAPAVSLVAQKKPAATSPAQQPEKISNIYGLISAFKKALFQRKERARFYEIRKQLIKMGFSPAVYEQALEYALGLKDAEMALQAISGLEQKFSTGEGKQSAETLKIIVVLAEPQIAQYAINSLAVALTIESTDQSAVFALREIAKCPFIEPQIAQYAINSLASALVTTTDFGFSEGIAYELFHLAQGGRKAVRDKALSSLEMALSTPGLNPKIYERIAKLFESLIRYAKKDTAQEVISFLESIRDIKASELDPVAFKVMGYALANTGWQRRGLVRRTSIFPLEKDGLLKKLAIIIHPVEDNNGAFKDIENKGKQLESRGYRVIIARVDGIDALLAALKAATAQQRASVIMIGGHGSRTSIQLGFGEPNSKLTIRDKQLKEKLSAAVGTLEENGIIILDSCSTGKGGRIFSNIAQLFADIFPQGFVFASPYPVVAEKGIKLVFNNKNEVTAVEFLHAYWPHGYYNSAAKRDLNSPKNLAIAEKVRDPEDSQNGSASSPQETKIANNQTSSPINSSETLLDPKDVLRPDGWRKLKLMVSFVRELINSGIEFDDGYYRGLFDNDIFLNEAERVFGERRLIPARIDTYIYNQATSVEQALIELIANAQDAVVNEKKIGRFGVGAYQMFRELKSPEDTIIVTTSTDGRLGWRITFKLIEGDLCCKTEQLSEGIEKGTTVAVNTKLSSEDVQERINYIKNKLHTNARSKITVNGILINNPEQYHYINGDNLVMPDIEPVQVEITGKGYVVIDKGSGMSPKTIWEKFLVPKGTTKAIEGKPAEKSSEIREETHLFYSNIISGEGQGRVAVQISGVKNIEVPIFGMNIPEELIIELPHDAWLPESRDKIAMDSVTREGLLEVMRKLTSPQRSDIANRYALINGVASLLRHILKDSEDKSLLYELRRMCSDYIQAEGFGKIFLPNRKELALLLLSPEQEVIFLDEQMFYFRPSNIPSVEKVRDFVSAAYELYIGNLDDPEESNIYIEGSYPDGRGWIILDRKVWEKHKADPAWLNGFLNFSIGYGDEGKNFGTIIKSSAGKVSSGEAGLSTDQLSSGPSIGKKGFKISQEEIDALRNDLISSKMIKEQLDDFEERDVNFIIKIAEESIAAGEINKGNIDEKRIKLHSWLALLKDLKRSLPEGMFSEAWLQKELYQVKFNIFSSQEIISSPEVANGKLYFYITRFGDETVHWTTFEINKQGTVISFEGARPVFTSQHIYLIEKDSNLHKISIRNSGENKIILEKVVGEYLEGSKNENLLALVQEGEIISIKIISGENVAEFCRLPAQEMAGMLSEKPSAVVCNNKYVVWFSHFGPQMIFKVNSSGDMQQIKIKGVDRIKTIAIFPNGNIAIAGHKKTSFQDDFLNKYSASSSLKADYFSGINRKAEIIFVDDHGKTDEYYVQDEGIWQKDDAVYFLKDKGLVRLNQNGESKMFALPNIDQILGSKKIDSLVFSGKYIYLVIAGRDVPLPGTNPLYRIEVDKEEAKEITDGSLSHTLITAGEQSYCISLKKGGSRKIRRIEENGEMVIIYNEWDVKAAIPDGNSLFVVREESRQGMYNKLSLYEISQDGKAKFTYSLEGVDLEFWKMENGEFMFLEDYDELASQEDEVSLHANPSEPFRTLRRVNIYNQRTGEAVKRSAIFFEGSYRNMVFLDGHPFAVESYQITAYPNLSLLIEQREYLRKNLTVLQERYLPQLFGLLSVLRQNERERLLQSLVTHKQWMPALIFLSPETILKAGEGIEQLRQILDDVVYKAKNIKQIRETFKFINFIFSTIKDEKIALRITGRWCKVFLKNPDLAEVIADKMQEKFDVPQDGFIEMFARRFGMGMNAGGVSTGKNPLEFYQDSKDLAYLPSEVRLYLDFLVSEELMVPVFLSEDRFSGRKTKAEIKGVDLSTLIRLRELSPDTILQHHDVQWEDVVLGVLGLNGSDIQGIRRDIAGAVNSQDKTQQYWIRELAQNARDAIRAMSGIEVKSGFLGHGFYTAFAGGCNEVRIRTGNGTYAYEIVLKPSYDPKGDMVDIAVVRMTRYESNFKGTQIQRVNYYNSTADEDVILGVLYTTRQVKRFLGAIPSTGEDGVSVIYNNELINEDGHRSENAARVIKIGNGVTQTPNKDGYYEWVVSITDPAGMDLHTILNKLLPPDVSGKPAQVSPAKGAIGANLESSFSKDKILRVTVDRLYVDDVDSKYTELVPQDIRQVLLKRGWNINFPQGTPVTRTRIGVMDSQYYRPWIAALALRSAVVLYLNEGIPELEGLIPKDYIYSNSNAIRVSPDILEDAEAINNGMPEKVDFSKYNNPHLLVQLFTVIKVAWKEERISLWEIKQRVLEEYKKTADKVSLEGILPPGLQGLRDRAESYITQSINKRRVDISFLMQEPIIIAFQEFVNILNRLIKVNNKTNFVCDIGAPYSAYASAFVPAEGAITWNLAYYESILQELLNFISTGALDGNFLKFIETYIHESSHTVEGSYQEKYKNEWTHQAARNVGGAFGWIMDLLYGRLLSNMGTPEEFREMSKKELEEMDFTIEALRESYEKVSNYIDQQTPPIGLSTLEKVEFKQPAASPIILKESSNISNQPIDTGRRRFIQLLGSFGLASLIVPVQTQAQMLFQCIIQVVTNVLTDREIKHINAWVKELIRLADQGNVAEFQQQFNRMYEGKPVRKDEEKDPTITMNISAHSVGFSMEAYTRPKVIIPNKLFLSKNFYNWKSEIKQEIVKQILKNAYGLGAPESFEVLEILDAISSNERLFNMLDMEEQKLLYTYIGKASVSQALLSTEKDVYPAIGRWINSIHDLYEQDGKWSEYVKKYLDSRFCSDEQLYILLSRGGFELYTGTFNRVFDELLKRIQASGNIIAWLSKVDSAGNMTSEFLLSLSGRGRLIRVIDASAVNLAQKEKMLKQICDIIRNIASANAKELMEEKTKMAYISNAVKDIFNYGNSNVNDYLKEIILQIKDNGGIYGKAFSLMIMAKFQNVFGSTPETEEIRAVLDYAASPPYEQILKPGKRLVVLVDFANSAKDFLGELVKQLSSNYGGRYKIRSHKPDVQHGIVTVIGGSINGVDIEFHLARGISGDEFRETMESGKYSIIFTRHHSYEGGDFLGVGSNTVIPQVIGTVGTGKGIENNAFSIVLSEEIAKTFSSRTGWDEVWHNMRKRLPKSMDNYLPPNHISFLISYVLNAIDTRSTKIDLNGDIHNKQLIKTIVVDGGCGGINRIPSYLNKYGYAIEKFKNHPAGSPLSIRQQVVPLGSAVVSGSSSPADKIERGGKGVDYRALAINRIRDAFQKVLNRNPEDREVMDVFGFIESDPDGTYLEERTYFAVAEAYANEIKRAGASSPIGISRTQEELAYYQQLKENGPLVFDKDNDRWFLDEAWSGYDYHSVRSLLTPIDLKNPDTLEEELGRINAIFTRFDLSKVNSFGALYAYIRWRLSPNRYGANSRVSVETLVNIIEQARDGKEINIAFTDPLLTQILDKAKDLVETDKSSSSPIKLSSRLAMIETQIYNLERLLLDEEKLNNGEWLELYLAAEGQIGDEALYYGNLKIVQDAKGNESKLHQLKRAFEPYVKGLLTKAKDLKSARSPLTEGFVLKNESRGRIQGLAEKWKAGLLSGLDLLSRPEIPKEEFRILARFVNKLVESDINAISVPSDPDTQVILDTFTIGYPRAEIDFKSTLAVKVSETAPDSGSKSIGLLKLKLEKLIEIIDVLEGVINSEGVIDTELITASHYREPMKVITQKFIDGVMEKIPKPPELSSGQIKPASSPAEAKSPVASELEIRPEEAARLLREAAQENYEKWCLLGERLKVARRILVKVPGRDSRGGHEFPLGEIAATLPILIKALVNSGKDIEELIVQCDSYPELVEAIGEDKVKLADPIQTTDELRSIYSPDLVIDFDTVALGEEIPESTVKFPVARLWMSSDRLGEMREILRSAQLITPESGETIIKREKKEDGQKTIFVNPHSDSNKNDNVDSWVGLIQELVSKGYKVVLNSGKEGGIDQAHTKNILEKLKKEVESGDVEEFKGSIRDLLDTFLSKIDGVITIDSGIFHVVHNLYSLPTVVFITSNTLGWIPQEKEELLFKRIQYSDFKDYSTIVALLRNLLEREKKVNTGSPVVENNIEKIKKYTLKSLKDFGYPENIFGGITRLENDKARAQVINGKVFFNEFWVDRLFEDEIERLCAHEVQHLSTEDLIGKGIKLGGLQKDKGYIELMLRIGSRFDRIFEEKGSVLTKPKEFYQDPWEALSLLRGYQIYLDQVARGIKVSPQAYEFIEAFENDDTIFLNPNYVQQITKNFIPEDYGYERVTYEQLDGKDENGGMSSPLLKQGQVSKESDVGGIDMRYLPNNMVLQPMAPNNSLNQRFIPRAASLTISDKEWLEIEKMANSGIAPSCERLREYLLSLQDPNSQIDKVLACIADILRQEEEKACCTESSLKEILVLLESGKPDKELRLALTKIQVLAKEPQLIEQ